MFKTGQKFIVFGFVETDGVAERGGVFLWFASALMLFWDFSGHFENDF